jgi:multidrug efflux pump subunit AcrA (membrane-fusion protein)
VADGDHVKDGQVVAVVVSQDSEAAQQGAQAMLKTARTPRERSDARRAVELARRGLVRTELRAPEAGVVVAHGADEGSLVADAQDLVSLAATDSFVFRADLAQTDLPRVHPGQRAAVRLASLPSPLQGTVHGILPAASSKDLTAPVRIDFGPSDLPPALGLLATAANTDGEPRDVPVVPAAAVLRDDITGVQRVAVVTDQGRVHWVQVTTGLTDAGKVELTSPEPKQGERLIIQGLVGLPEGAAVQVEP